MNLLNPLLFGFLLTHLYKKKVNEVFKILILLIFINTLIVFVNQVKTNLHSLIHNNIMYDIRDKIYKKVIRLPLQILNEIKSGKITSLFNSDANIIANLVSNR